MSYLLTFLFNSVIMRHLKNKGIKMNIKLRTFGLMVIAALTLAACGSGGGNDNKMEAYPFEGTPPISEALKNEYLSAINGARSVGRYCGQKWFDAAPPVVWNNALYSASYEHSQDMANTGRFDHTGSNTVHDWTAQVQNLGRGSNGGERVMNNGYPRDAGENIAIGYATTQGVVNAWLVSEYHCVNIMLSSFKSIGMAKVGEYWTQESGEE